MAELENNGIEIPEDMLESIAGGVLDEVTMSNLRGLVKGFKMNGYDLDQILKAFDYLKHASDGEEIFDYIREQYIVL